jgi:hypothetical protein
MSCFNRVAIELFYQGVDQSSQCVTISYQWLYQHLTLNMLLKCCKNIDTWRGQVCGQPLHGWDAPLKKSLMITKDLSIHVHYDI